MRTVDVDVTRREIRDELTRWGVSKGDFEIMWEESRAYQGRPLGAKVEFYRHNVWQTISCFRLSTRAENLRQCFLLIQRLRIAEKFGVQYAGLTSAKEVATTKNSVHDEKRDLLDALDTLGVGPDDPVELIKDVYRKKATYFHPDSTVVKGGNTEKFKRITDAFNLILKSRGVNTT